MQNELTPQQAI